MQVLERSKGQVYVHYINQDKRLDEWIDERDCRPAEDMSERRDGRSRKRKRHTSASSGLGSHSDDTLPLHEEDVPLTEEEIDLQTHKQITAQRNFETVHFGNWQIKTWYVCLAFFYSCCIVQAYCQVFFSIPAHRRRRSIPAFNRYRTKNPWSCTNNCAVAWENC